MIKMVRGIFLLGLFFLAGYVFGVKEVRFVRIVSLSMEPSLREDDRIVSFRADRIKRGDIVTLLAPKGERGLLVKRVIGLPGEKVEVKRGSVFINGEKLREPYIEEPPFYELLKKTGEDEYFLLGDNRNRSEDSSAWGPVSGKLFSGKVFCRYWPLRDFKMFTGFSVRITEK